jgi:hypothetical protein
MMRTLLDKHGAVDRSALMRDAQREWRDARRRGWDQPDADRWTWSRCLRLAQARARREREMRAVEMIGNAVRQMVDSAG